MTQRTVALAAVVLLASGCSGSVDRLDPECGPDGLRTKRPGVITLSTGAVTRAPWVTGPRLEGRSADPRNGKGYDAAVGFELARRLGFERQDVRWVATAFADALAPGPKAFDVNVNQVTIRPDRAEKVDLSRSYYDVRHAVVTLKGGRAAQLESLSDLEDLTIGYVTGSSSAQAVRALSSKAAVGQPDDDELRRALTSGEVDVVVTSYLTALRLDADESQLVDGELVGVLADAPTTDERFGMVLEKGSSLTRCVDQALAAMKDDGTLERLERTWLAQEHGWTWLD